MWKQSFCNCLIALIASNVCAENFRIDPTSNLKPLLSRIHAGDTIVLTNGIWSDIDLRFEELPGTLNQPIHIRAESVGKVVMTGAVKFRVSGTHVVISGLRFSDPSEVSDVFELRTHSQRHAHKCRVTDCWFEQTKDTGKFESRWLNVYGTGNRIDHCYFEGKRTQGPTLVVWVADQTEKHRLDHNHFGPRPKLGKNGGETIRVGTSDTSEFDCSTIVEENFFDRCNGEGEIISNKSCGNVYRHNLFERCEGALTLRHGQATQLWLGSPCILPTVDSTNQFLINNPGIRLVIANQQTAGRGQRNHSWFSPEGKNIYLSVRWRTRTKPDITETSVLVAQAVQQLFTESGIRQTTIKPPNDVMINGGKAAGILIEAFTQGTWVDLVTGIGINV